MVDSFLKNLKKKSSSKSRVRRECVSTVANVNCTTSPVRKRSKSNKSKKSKRSQGAAHSLTFDIRERENYNRKLDETV
jgi:hypothetical protein